MVVPRRFPEREVEPFVREKSAWIERTLRRFAESELRVPAAARSRTGARCPTWASGSALRVRVEPGRGART